MGESNKNRVNIANRLRLAREMAGLSQGQAAKLLKLHRPSLTEIEAGRRKVSAEELAELAKIYDVSILWLVGKADEQSSEVEAKYELAARELSKLKNEDIDRLFRILSSMRIKR